MVGVAPRQLPAASAARARYEHLGALSQPRPVRSVQRGEGWTPESIAEHAIPALRKSFVPLDVSADVFSWDPV